MFPINKYYREENPPPLRYGVKTNIKLLDYGMKSFYNFD